MASRLWGAAVRCLRSSPSPTTEWTGGGLPRSLSVGTSRPCGCRGAAGSTMIPGQQNILVLASRLRAFSCTGASCVTVAPSKPSFWSVRVPVRYRFRIAGA
uniref:Uncharacterized protein n=1 Tax=Arundo donax TaxID=35708 RepID=A0A0A9CRW9_ARUDO